MVVATATEVQNNFGKFLRMVNEGESVRITRNGHEVARLVSQQHGRRYALDSLVGILHGEEDRDSIRAERLARYEDSH